MFHEINVKKEFNQQSSKKIPCSFLLFFSTKLWLKYFSQLDFSTMKCESNIYALGVCVRFFAQIYYFLCVVSIILYIFFAPSPHVRFFSHFCFHSFLYSFCIIFSCYASIFFLHESMFSSASSFFSAEIFKYLE